MRSYQTFPMYNVTFGEQIFFTLPGSIMVKPKKRADHFHLIRAMGHQENNICSSKASKVYKPDNAQLVYLITTLHHLPKGFL